MSANLQKPADIPLSVPFTEKDKVKALGAYWDAGARLWCVPATLDLAPFAKWIPPSRKESTPPAAGKVRPVTPTATGNPNTALCAPPKGLTLSSLLTRIGKAVEDAFRGAEWVQAEIAEITIRNGHAYLDLVERNTTTGALVAKSRAAIWANRRSVVEKFCQATGVELAAGIKVLVRIQPKFTGNYGLTLEIVDIDPAYTLGEAEAKLRRIRDSLRKEGIFERNRERAEPADFTRLAVISPEGAAGLGDLRREADLLAGLGLCEFIYYAATFQGDAAPASIGKAIREAIADAKTKPIDALAIIRGGGAVADLQWLNDEGLARLVATAPVPVLTGIGHEKDNTILDEVARLRFDTPSKVIGHVYRVIVGNCQIGEQSFKEVGTAAARRILRIETETAARHDLVMRGAQQLVALAAVRTRELSGHILHGAEKHLHTAERTSTQSLQEIRTGVTWRPVRAMEQADRWLTDIDHGARRRPIRVMEQASAFQEGIQAAAANRIGLAEIAAAGLIETIVTRGPSSTLARGYAIVRDAENGRVIPAAGKLPEGAKLFIEFRDGVVKVEQVA